MTPFAALILAAGRSLRMGRAKAWLSLEGKPLLQHVADATADAGASRVVVVAGCEDADGGPSLVSRIEVAARLAWPAGRPRLSVAIGAPDGAPIDSIRAGLALVPDSLAVLLWPVDHPFADAALVRRLAAALGGDRGRLAVPTIAGRRAHPVLFGAAVAPELASSAADGGAHLVVRQDPRRVVAIAAEDRRLLAELNTPAQARGLGIAVE